MGRASSQQGLRNTPHISFFDYPHSSHGDDPRVLARRAKFPWYLFHPQQLPQHSLSMRLDCSACRHPPSRCQSQEIRRQDRLGLHWPSRTGATPLGGIPAISCSTRPYVVRKAATLLSLSPRSAYLSLVCEEDTRSAASHGELITLLVPVVDLNVFCSACASEKTKRHDQTILSIKLVRLKVVTLRVNPASIRGL